MKTVATVSASSLNERASNIHKRRYSKRISTSDMKEGGETPAICYDARSKTKQKLFCNVQRRDLPGKKRRQCWKKQKERETAAVVYGI